MATWSEKPSATTTPRGRCPSLTVLFFAERDCFLPEDVKTQALKMGISAATARYAEVEPNSWVLQVVVHYGKTVRRKTSMPVRHGVTPTYGSAAMILTGEIRHAYRCFKVEQQALLDAPTQASS